MSYSISISEVSNNITIEAPADNQISVSSTAFPITIEYNATVFSGVSFPSDGDTGQIIRLDSLGDAVWDDQTTISESEPQVPYLNQQWLNPTTKVLKIYSVLGWVQVTADDGQF
jgi:hypothetical protein